MVLLVIDAVVCIAGKFVVGSVLIVSRRVISVCGCVVVVSLCCCEVKLISCSSVSSV